MINDVFLTFYCTILPYVSAFAYSFPSNPAINVLPLFLVLYSLVTLKIDLKSFWQVVILLAFGNVCQVLWSITDRILTVEEETIFLFSFSDQSKGSVLPVTVCEI